MLQKTKHTKQIIIYSILVLIVFSNLYQIGVYQNNKQQIRFLEKERKIYLKAVTLSHLENELVGAKISIDSILCDSLMSKESKQLRSKKTCSFKMVIMHDSQQCSSCSEVVVQAWENYAKYIHVPHCRMSLNAALQNKYSYVIQKATSNGVNNLIVIAIVDKNNTILNCFIKDVNNVEKEKSFSRYTLSMSKFVK